jgi:predicted PurR-regulated permease PerM
MTDEPRPQGEEKPGTGETSDRRELRREWNPTGIVAFGFVALLVLSGAVLILRPFIDAILLGAIIVILTHPLYVRLRRRLAGRAGLAAVLMLLGITFLLILPALLIAMLLVAQANSLVANLQHADVQATLASFDLPGRLAFIQRFVPSFDPAVLSLERMVVPVVRQVPGWVARNGATVVGNLAGLVLGFFLVLLSAYYFFVEGHAILRQLAVLSPFPRRYDIEIAGKFAAVIDATFRGQVMTSLAQGVATAVGLFIARVPGALLWGSVAAILSLLPMVGAAVIWVPATIYLAVMASMDQMGWGWAIFLALWGVLVVSTIDNVVRPWVMRGRAELPAIPLLFAVLGGLQAFGFIGLVVGPLIFSLVKSLVDIYKESFRERGSGGSAAPSAPAGDSPKEPAAASDAKPVPAG